MQPISSALEDTTIPRSSCSIVGRKATIEVQVAARLNIAKPMCHPFLCLNMAPKGGFWLDFNNLSMSGFAAFESRATTIHTNK
jgi:hypothetical protein